MEMRGSRLIGAPRERVWAALTDPETLRACVPGCDSMEGDVASGFSARITQRLGPIHASFTGSVELVNMIPGVSYRLICHGDGETAGRALVGADVKLVATEDGDTRIDYVVIARLEGRIARLGAVLIDKFALKAADRFFTRFQCIVEGGPIVAPPEKRAWFGRMFGR